MDDYPKCAKCGSHDLKEAYTHRFGAPTILAIISSILSFYTPYTLGCNGAFIGDIKKRLVCKVCGSDKIIHSKEEEPSETHVLEKIATILAVIAAIALFVILWFALMNAL